MVKKFNYKAFVALKQLQGSSFMLRNSAKLKEKMIGLVLLRHA
ncbi:hypothetical protein [Streptococcus suis]